MVSQRAATTGRPIARGVVVAPWREAHPDRIVLADLTFFLRDGTKPPGTPLQVVYEQNGRSYVKSVKASPRRTVVELIPAASSPREGFSVVQSACLPSGLDAAARAGLQGPQRRLLA